MNLYYEYLALDVPPLLTALFASMTCALLGSFLLLRRQSLMGDAISHAVLPGIVGAFLIASSREDYVVFLGAGAAGLLTVVLVELVHKLGRLEIGAAMGVVFSIFFAAGVLLMEQAAARNVDLDADCLLHGQLESIFWFPPKTVPELLSWQTLQRMPQEVFTSLFVFVVVALFVVLLYKELRLAAFDPAHATSLGFRAAALHYLLMMLVAAAVVASFKAVGSILVIGMLICPAAAARLLTDRLHTQLCLSMFLACIAVIAGYVAASLVPAYLAWPHSVNAAGSMISTAGLMLAAAALFAPRHGIIARRMRSLRLTARIIEEDILGFFYRREERQIEGALRSFSELPGNLSRGRALVGPVSWLMMHVKKSLVRRNGLLVLSDKGRAAAARIVRSHRLWEDFLVEDAGLQAGEVHDIAHQLEHLPAAALEHRSTDGPVRTDPHGRPIPDVPES